MMNIYFYSFKDLNNITDTALTLNWLRTDTKMTLHWSMWIILYSKIFYAFYHLWKLLQVFDSLNFVKKKLRIAKNMNQLCVALDIFIDISMANAITGLFILYFRNRFEYWTEYFVTWVPVDKKRVYKMRNIQRAKFWRWAGRL